MTHSGPMPDSAGDFAEWKRVEISCPKCEAEYVVARTWESKCGGYEDTQFKCAGCGRVWWVDGPDS